MLEDGIEFCKDVEKLILEDIFDSYIDAVLHLCDDKGVEPFMAARLLSKPIKEKIIKEGQEVNLLPKQAKLPIKK